MDHIAAAAALLEARGVTSPERHDLILVKFGARVRVVEVGARNGRVKAKFGETSVGKIQRMLASLPPDHNVGLVSVVIGRDFVPDSFLRFVRKQAQRRNFSLMTSTSPRPTKEVFDRFYEALGDVQPMGEC